VSQRADGSHRRRTGHPSPAGHRRAPVWRATAYDGVGGAPRWPRSRRPIARTSPGAPTSVDTVGATQDGAGDPTDRPGGRASSRRFRGRRCVVRRPSSAQGRLPTAAVDPTSDEGRLPTVGADPRPDQGGVPPAVPRPGSAVGRLPTTGTRPAAGRRRGPTAGTRPTADTARFRAPESGRPRPWDAFQRAERGRTPTGYAFQRPDPVRSRTREAFRPLETALPRTTDAVRRPEPVLLPTRGGFQRLQGIAARGWSRLGLDRAPAQRSPGRTAVLGAPPGVRAGHLRTPRDVRRPRREPSGSAKNRDPVRTVAYGTDLAHARSR
jgi:hypothetical protein